MKTGIVDVGGGMRGVYSAGIYDFCLDRGINFDLCIGVSAGSANMSSFLGGQRGRNYKFYCEYSFRDEYMGPEHFIKDGSFINFPYIYKELSNSDGECPLDYERIMENKCDFLVVATNALTGKPMYFPKSSLKKDDYIILSASCCIPGINKPIEIDGVPYFDGALSDCVPIEKAFSEGCDRVVLVLTKPISTVRSVGKDAVMSRMIEKEYPESAKGLYDRAVRYNLMVKRAKKYREEGKLLILAPSDTSGVTTLKRDKEAMTKLYKRGYSDGKKLLKWF